MPRASGPRASRSGGLLALAGAAISVASFLTYFTVVPRWAGLRDSGVPNVILAVAGAGLSFAGFRRSHSARRGRLLAVPSFSLAVLCAALLSIYIFWLSYRLPGTEGVVAVGERAPSFHLLDQDGRERTIEEFRGRPILLVFFRGHW